MMSVGGEFGLALVAIALDAGVLDARLGQIAITTTLLTMVLGAILIRFNRPLARQLVRSRGQEPGDVPALPQPEVALKALSYLSRICPQVPVIARARDLESSALLQKAGALHAHPETIEASLRLGAIALDLLKVPTGEIEDELQSVRDWGYTPVADPEPDSDG